MSQKLSKVKVHNLRSLHHSSKSRIRYFKEYCNVHCWLLKYNSMVNEYCNLFMENNFIP